MMYLKVTYRNEGVKNMLGQLIRMFLADGMAEGIKIC